MGTKIQIKRGLSANFASQVLSAGEPAFLTDTGKLYVGDGTNKILINSDNTSVGYNNIFATFVGTDISIGTNKPVALNSSIVSGSGLSLLANGGVRISAPGIYSIAYNVSSSSTLIKLALSNTIDDGNFFAGTYSTCSSIITSPFTSVSGSYIRNVTATEDIFLKNLGILTIFLSSSCSMSIIRIA